MIELAKKNAAAIGAGHSFIVFLGDGFYPLNVLNTLKMVPEVCHIFCATANPTEVVLAEMDQGRGILGVVDGFSPKASKTKPRSSGGKTSCGRSGTSCESRDANHSAERSAMSIGCSAAYERLGFRPLLPMISPIVHPSHDFTFQMGDRDFWPTQSRS